MCAKMYSQLPRFNCVVSLVWFDCLVSFVVGTIRKVIITVSTEFVPHPFRVRLGREHLFAERHCIIIKALYNNNSVSQQN